MCLMCMILCGLYEFWDGIPILFEKGLKYGVSIDNDCATVVSFVIVLF